MKSMNSRKNKLNSKKKKKKKSWFFKSMPNPTLIALIAYDEPQAKPFF